jgi:hypothetical protein
MEFQGGEWTTIYWPRPFCGYSWLRHMLDARASMYIVDVARGLGLYKTSPNSLVHLTTIVRPVVNERWLAIRTMPNGITVQIVSDRNISWGNRRVAVKNRRHITVVSPVVEICKWRLWCLSDCPSHHTVSYSGSLSYHVCSLHLRLSNFCKSWQLVATSTHSDLVLKILSLILA